MMAAFLFNHQYQKCRSLKDLKNHNLSHDYVFTPLLWGVFY